MGAMVESETPGSTGTDEAHSLHPGGSINTKWLLKRGPKHDLEMKCSRLAFIILVTSAGSIFASLDFFSSTLKTKSLQERHNQLLPILRDYASSLSQASSIINWFLSDTELEKVSQPWPDEGDPLRTYVLIRRTTADLENIIAAIRKHRSLDPILEIDNMRQQGLLPSMDDYLGISGSIVRLQRTYLLQQKDVLEGNISADFQPSVKLSAKDCLQLGQTAEKLTPTSTIPVDARLWYQAGLDAFKNETQYVDSDLEGKLKTGLDHVKNISKKFYRFPPEFQDFVSNDNLTEPLKPETNWDYVHVVYRRLCRGEQLRAHRSTHVVNITHGGVSDLRLSATAWIPDSSVPSLAIKLDAFLGMNSNSTIVDVEPFQVLNYGVGGHYSLHRDHFENFTGEKFLTLGNNRLATLMFYISDVEKGGATAFPYAGLALKPIKGAAAFWWNLRTDGSGDHRTTHGACPVIYGTKWVTNKWFRADPQMFRVPCGLRREDIAKSL